MDERRLASGGPKRIRRFGIVNEALASVTQRPVRSFFTCIGTALGVAAFVAIVGLTASASQQISDRFTSRSASEVTIRPISDGLMDVSMLDRLAALNGVESVGYRKNIGEIAVKTGPATVGRELPAIAVTPGYWDVVRPRLDEGRVFGQWQGRDRVAVVGRTVARETQLPSVLASPTILVQGVAFTVIGVIEDADRDSSALTSVVIPVETARALWPGQLRGQQTVLIETKVGSAALIAGQAPLALDPYDPSRFPADPAPRPSKVRNGVDTDLRVLLFALAGVTLLIGTVGIANMALISVMERVHEIGLRRALGARPVHIVAQFLMEASLLGAIGGMLGGLVGVVITTGVAVARDWTPVSDPLVTLAAPLAGMLIGLLAGLYPSLRASRIQPVEALRN
jgi:putative ABC transport system permease protein